MTTQNFKECCTLPGRSDDASWNILQGGRGPLSDTILPIRLVQGWKNQVIISLLYTTTSLQRRKTKKIEATSAISKCPVHPNMMRRHKYYLVQCYALFIVQPLVHQLLPAPTSCRAKGWVEGGGGLAGKREQPWPSLSSDWLTRCPLKSGPDLPPGLFNRSTSHKEDSVEFITDY